jgi:tRNA threonylcarbamoyladenosine biosynthesis protein TsaB
MKILAVDTALGACSAVVLDGDHILAHRFVPMDRGHAEAIAPMVDDVMREAGIAFTALDRLGVTTGPGTFTGQRIGLSFMRGLRVALKRPLIGITTLEAMCAAARDAAKTQMAAAIHDAKRDEAYLAITSGETLLLSSQLVRMHDAASLIAATLPGNSPVALAGTGAQSVEAILGKRAKLTDIRQPDALWVARLALQADATSHPPNPLYLRAPDAKLPAGKS